MYEKNPDGYYKNRHSCFLLSYHLVLVTKYRKPVLTGVVLQTVKDIEVWEISRDLYDDELKVLEIFE